MIPHASYQLFRAGRQLTPFEQREADAQIGRCSKWLSDTLTRLRTPGFSLTAGEVERINSLGRR
ncbi:MAG TPA: hypothetical protein VGL75_13135 [Acidothermaceae bacterium]